MAMNYGGEYTPEITQDYLKTLQTPILAQGAQDVGRARGEALRRGMAGDPFEALRVGAAQRTMNTNLSNANANLGFQVAGVAQQERVGVENREDAQTFQSVEREKQNAFSERMAQIQRDWEAQMQRAKERAEKRSFWPNLLSGVVSTGAGIYAGKKLAGG